MSGAPPSVHFAMDDRDLDDAELWAVIDSASNSHSLARSRKPILSLKHTSSPIVVTPVANASPVPARPSSRNPRYHRPPKMARFVDPAPYGGEQNSQMVFIRNQPQNPIVSSPSPSPDVGGILGPADQPADQPWHALFLALVSAVLGMSLFGFRNLFSWRSHEPHPSENLPPRMNARTTNSARRTFRFSSNSLDLSLISNERLKKKDIFLHPDFLINGLPLIKVQSVFSRIVMAAF